MNIYKTTNLINNKIYIGQHIIDNDDKYLGSGKIFCLALEKYGRENFKKEILEYCDSRKELNEREKYWIEYYNSTDRNIGYNISPGGNGGYLCEKYPEKLRGKNYYLNKMTDEKKENHLNKYRRGINYWKSKGFKTLDEVEQWIKENWCGENHSHRKYKTEEEYQQWLNEHRRGDNYWLNKLSPPEKEKYINEHYKGKNNPIFRNKTNEEIEDWLNKNRRNENAPNAKYIYTIITNTGEKIVTECLKKTCKERNFNLFVLRGFIEVSEGKRKEYIPRKKEYLNWTVARRKKK